MHAYFLLSGKRSHAWEAIWDPVVTICWSDDALELEHKRARIADMRTLFSFYDR